MSFLKKVEALRMGGPAGPIDIEKARDKEVDFERGLPKLVVLVRPQYPKKLDDFNKGVGGPFESDTGSYPFILPDLLSAPDRGWPQSGQNSPDRGWATEDTIPVRKVISKAPEQDPKKEETNKKDKIEVKVTPPKDKAAEEPVKIDMEDQPRPKYFTQLVGIVRSLFPQLKMAFPSPPTFIWNPPGQSAPSDEGPKEVKPLDPKDVKNKLKMKFPDLGWDKSHDGVDVSSYEFPDGSRAELAIGLDANHLTITYFPPGR